MPSLSSSTENVTFIARIGTALKNQPSETVCGDKSHYAPRKAVRAPAMGFLPQFVGFASFLLGTAQNFRRKVRYFPPYRRRDSLSTSRGSPIPLSRDGFW